MEMQSIFSLITVISLSFIVGAFTRNKPIHITFICGVAISILCAVIFEFVLSEPGVGAFFYVALFSVSAIGVFSSWTGRWAGQVISKK